MLDNDRSDESGDSPPSRTARALGWIIGTLGHMDADADIIYAQTQTIQLRARLIGQGSMSACDIALATLVLMIAEGHSGSIQWAESLKRRHGAQNPGIERWVDGILQLAKTRTRLH